MKTLKTKFLKTSDFLLFTTVALGLVLEMTIPTSIILNKNIMILVGILTLIFAWLIIIIAKMQFKKFHQKTRPNSKTTKLITGGIFKYSRNPIYLGIVMISCSISFLANSWWLLGSTILLIFLLQFKLILPEEQILTTSFKKRYIEYCNQTRRWF